MSIGIRVSNLTDKEVENLLPKWAEVFTETPYTTRSIDFDVSICFGGYYKYQHKFETLGTSMFFMLYEVQNIRNVEIIAKYFTENNLCDVKILFKTENFVECDFDDVKLFYGYRVLFQITPRKVFSPVTRWLQAMEIGIILRLWDSDETSNYGDIRGADIPGKDILEEICQMSKKIPNNHNLSTSLNITPEDLKNLFDVGLTEKSFQMGGKIYSPMGSNLIPRPHALMPDNNVSTTEVFFSLRINKEIEK